MNLRNNLFRGFKNCVAAVADAAEEVQKMKLLMVQYVGP